MNGMKQIHDYLSIVIVTYNRAKLLDRTLNNILRSPFQSCAITVLDNCSTDDTRTIALEHQRLHSNLVVITNRFNIGGDANIMRAVEYASTKYLWVLADDDTYDFSYCDDVIDKLCNEDIDLLHVGGHKELAVPSGNYLNPKEAIDNGYPFFKTSSFMPANIFKVELMRDTLISGYKNIKNSYAHMPLFIKMYENDASFYISKNKIVVAEIGEQKYTNIDLLEWWVDTAYSYIKDNNTRLQYIYSQFFPNLQKYKYLRLLKSLLSNHIRLPIVLETLLMRNFAVSFMCLLFVQMWRIGAYIKKCIYKNNHCVRLVI